VENQAINDDSAYETLKKVCKESSKKRRQKEHSKTLLLEIKRLKDEHQVPMKTIAKRLRINYRKLCRIIKLNINDPEIAFKRS
jgi:hypothetical protein